jgi:hypothetical protein
MRVVCCWQAGPAKFQISQEANQGRTERIVSFLDCSPVSLPFTLCLSDYFGAHAGGRFSWKAAMLYAGRAARRHMVAVRAFQIIAQPHRPELASCLFVSTMASGAPCRIAAIIAWISASSEPASVATRLTSRWRERDSHR